MAHYRITLANAHRVLTLCAASIAALITSSTLADCRFWDSSIGQPGMNSDVLALIEHDGHLIAGGHFISAGGQLVYRIARWDDSTSAWEPLGPGFDDRVRALAVHNGNLIAAGDFNFAMDATPLNKIARWDGASGQWHPLGGGLDSRVLALTIHDGDLIAGGRFTFADAPGIVVNNIARWDGEQWHALGEGLDDDVHALASFNSTLIAAGRFEEAVASAEPLNHIARWDAKLEMWQPLASGSGVDDDVHALAVFAGDLIAAGSFDNASFIKDERETVTVQASHIARWDGAQWHSLGDGLDDRIFALTVFRDRLIAGGRFDFAGQTEVNHIAQFNGASWHSLGAGVDDRVHALLAFDGALIAGGEFREVGPPAPQGLPANRIARWIELEPAVPADLDCDGVVGVADLLILLANWGPCPDRADCPADLNGDGNVGVADLLILLANWG